MTETLKQEASALAEWLTENWKAAATVLAFLFVVYSQFEGLKVEQRRTTEATLKLQETMTEVQIEMAGLSHDLKDVTGESQRAWDRLHALRDDVHDLKAEISALKAREVEG